MSEVPCPATNVEQPCGVGYVVKRFPRLSETFILNELRALRALGSRVEVFSLMEPESDQQHELLAELDIPVHYLPGRAAVSELRLTRRNYGRKEEHHRTLKQWLHETVVKSVMPPFPGKRMTQCAALQIQASLAACLATARRLEHLHAHFASDAATVAMLASRLSQIPFSMTAHAKDIYHTYSNPQRDRAFLATKLREAKFTVTVSDYNRQYLQELGGTGARVLRLYNGVDLQQLQPHMGPRESRLIVAVGRLVEKKGFRYLVEACSHLRREGVDFHCVIIGEGPEREQLQERIRSRGLQEQVTLAGSLTQREVFDWLRRATLFTLPCVISSSGDRDGLPTVILECMALGTPVVTTRVTGNPEMIDHGKSGWLVEPEQAEALAETLHLVLEASPEQRIEVARQARLKAENQFDLYRNVAALNVLFGMGSGRTVRETTEAC